MESSGPKRSRETLGFSRGSAKSQKVGEVGDFKGTKKTVVIVGAGAAGLSTAKTLLEFSREIKVIVLEGRNRPGGRVNTTSFAGSMVDLGASYIHGCNRPENWVLSLAKELDVDIRREYGGYQSGWLERCLWFDPSKPSDRKRVTAAEIRAAWAVFLSVSESLSDRASVLCMQGTDMTVGDYLCYHLPHHLQKRISNLNKSSSDVFWKFVHTVWGYVGPVDQLSARLMAHEFRKDEENAAKEEENDHPNDDAGGKEHGGNTSGGSDSALQEEDALVVSGYSFLIHELMKGVDIRYEKTVRTIRHRGADGGATVYTSDGDQFQADAVVVTVPLGVLQGKHAETRIHFIPGLQEAKMEAISSLAMGVENKVLLHFSEPFWPTSSSPYIQTTVQGIRFLSLHHYGKPGVIVAHLCPPVSITISKLTDVQAVQFVMGVLRDCFGAASVEKSTLMEYLVTRWHQDPYSMGSYSFMPAGSTFEHIHALKKTEGCLLFAGEATSAFDGQCVTGAFDTGHDAALETLENVFKMRLCQSCEMFSLCDSECDACKVDANQLFCICRQPADDSMYVQCVGCEEWFHLRCMGLEEAPIKAWYCKQCDIPELYD